MTHASLSSEEQGRLLQSALFNHDLAPVPPERRSWRYWNFAALWISMSACIPTYMLASSLIGGGMNWWEAILTIFLGNVIVLIPMILNAHAGTRYGIPFPVYCRAAFRHQRRQCPGAVARPGRVRLVWHSNLDRRGGYSQDSGRVLSRRWAGRPGMLLASRCRSLSASCFSGASTCLSSIKASTRFAFC